MFRHAPLKFLGRSIANRNCIGRAFQTRLARRVFDSAILVLFPTLRVDKIDDRFANNQKMHLRVSWLGNVAQYGQLRVACHGQMVVVIIFQEHRNYNTVSAYIAVMLILYKQPCVMSGSTDAMA